MAKRRLMLDGWREEFKKKLVSPEEAAGVIQSGDYVVLPNEYFGVLPYYLVERKKELSNVTVEICVAFFDPGWLQPGMGDAFNIIIRCYLHLARTAHDEGRIPFIPVTNGTWLKQYRDNRQTNRDIDVFLVVVSPPDENGLCYFANGIWEKRFYAGKAKTVIFSTHILAEVEATCSRVIIINEGKVVGSGTIDELQNKARSGILVYTKIKGPQDDILNKLKSLDKVTEVKTTGEANQYEIAVSQDTNINEAIFLLAKDNNWVLSELYSEKATLEDVFLKLTKKQ